jgi:hypothetical protein
MSLRSIRLSIWLSVSLTASLALVGCGSTAPARDEPTTAKEKQRREATSSGAADGPSTKWGRWRYTGSREDCFFVVSGRCFKTQAAACTAAKCGKRTCEVTGGGPATVTCAKP